MSYGSRGPPPDTEGMVSLKVDNLTFRTAPEDLRRTFEKYGDVGDVYIPRDRFTKQSRGFAFVRYYDKRDAEDAMDELDGRDMDGRQLRVTLARYGRPERRPAPRPRWGGGGGYGGGGGRYRSSRRRSYSRSRSRSRSPAPRRRRSRSYNNSRSRSRSRSQSNSRRAQMAQRRSRDSRSPRPSHSPSPLHRASRSRSRSRD